MEQPVNFACLPGRVMEYKHPDDKCLDADRKRQHATPA